MVPNETAAVKAPLNRVIVKLQFEQDYATFMREGKVAPTLSAIAKILDVAPAEISLLEVRSGCTIMVLRVTEGQAKKLQEDFKARRDGEAFADIAGISAEQVEVLNSNTSVVRLLGSPYFNPNIKLTVVKPDLTWLHISDLHIKEDYADPTSDTRADLKQFLDDLPECLGEKKIKPDAVFFTGDVSQSGTSVQYQQAEVFFQQLRSKLPAECRKAPFLVIPGNHDVNWPDIDVVEEMKMRDELAGPEYDSVIAAYLAHIDKRHANYGTFSKKFNGTGCQWFDAHAFSRCFTVGPSRLKIGVAGLNSAWLSTRQDLLKLAHGIDNKKYPNLDLESLVLGPKQIRRAKKFLEDSKVDLQIALVHHEPRSPWYRDYDRQLQRKELKYFDFVLRGHQHEPQARQGVTVAGRDDYVELAPAALRTRPDYFQGFMAAELDFSARMMRLTAWKPTPTAGRWRPDLDFGNDGEVGHHLPEPLLERLNGRSHKVLTV
ncbi:metallophosphoesterase family protein [Mycolicibacterium lutetiense]